jgi:proteasome lid subunit RPN8/RPN11
MSMSHLKNLHSIKSDASDITEVLLAESAEFEIFRAARDSHPNETGGILFGTWSSGRPWITHAIEIQSAKPSPAHYTLPGGITHDLATLARLVDHRLGYLGEWHVHPLDVGPSGTDARTMRRLTRLLEVPPVLLLARQGSHHLRLEADFWPSSRQRSLSILRTGDLLVSEDRSSSES